MSTPPKATPTTPIDDDPPQWAMQRAAQAWCASTTKYIEMDPALCREFAHILAEGPHAPPPAAQPSDAAGLSQAEEDEDAFDNWNRDITGYEPSLFDAYCFGLTRGRTALAPYLKGEPGDSELLDWILRECKVSYPERYDTREREWIYRELVDVSAIRAAMRGERGAE